MHAAGHLSLGAARHGKETDGEGHGESRAYDDHPVRTPGDVGSGPCLRAHPGARGGETDIATAINITFAQLVDRRVLCGERSGSGAPGGA
jgi:hypothetical protein